MDRLSNLVANPPPEGFKKLEPVNGTRRFPPKIGWGQKFEGWKQARQIRYLKELSESMNHAADLLQKERNALNVVVRDKDEIIANLQKKMQGQADFIQEEITNFNKTKQDLLEDNIKLKRKIKALEDGS